MLTPALAARELRMGMLILLCQAPQHTWQEKCYQTSNVWFTGNINGFDVYLVFLLSHVFFSRFRPPMDMNRVDIVSYLIIDDDVTNSFILISFSGQVYAWIQPQHLHRWNNGWKVAHQVYTEVSGSKFSRKYCQFYPPYLYLLIDDLFEKSEYIYTSL